MKENTIQGHIICVDTWLGGFEHFVDKDHPNRYRALQVRHGYPTLYYQFLANVVHSGQKDVIIPLPQTSKIGARILRELGLRADLIYLDASHDCRTVAEDLESYWDLLTDDGVLFGDDYTEQWAGVVEAVDAFVAERRLQLFTKWGKWIILGRRADTSVLEP